MGVAQEKFKRYLNQILIFFFIPVITLYHLPEQQFEWDYVWLLTTPWLIYLFSILFFETVHKLFPIKRQTRAVLIMTSGIGSISFAGFPIFEAFYGPEGLAYGIVLSLAGTFVVCNTIGSFTGFWYKSKKIIFGPIFWRMIKFPPFIAMILSFVLIFFDYEHPKLIGDFLRVLSAPFSVLALLAVGLNFGVKSLKEFKNQFFLGQFYKLVLSPLIVFIVLFLFGEHQTVIGKICILGAGIGSMNTIALIAMQQELNPRLAALMPAVGIPLSILTLLLIQYLLM